MLVSVVINNFNYGRFVAEAIESALAQRDANVEVIVVDDGSTDDSRGVIQGYADAIVAVLKENGGQASAFNAGFAHARGDVVLFLDADDALLPDTASRAAGAFLSDPNLAWMQFRVELIDADGRTMRIFEPPAEVPLPQGDLRRAALRFPDAIVHPPTSGNAFAAWALRQIFPVPERDFRILADMYLLALTPLLGSSSSIDAVGAKYRVHGGNQHYGPGLELDRLRQMLVGIQHVHLHKQALADRLGLSSQFGDSNEASSTTSLARRLASLKLDSANHPIAGDRTLSLVVSGLAAALRRSDMSLWRRFLWGLWFVAMALAPRALGTWLTERLFFPRTRNKLTGVLVRPWTPESSVRR